jgi:RND family efflux transporter MFP subunit
VTRLARIAVLRVPAVLLALVAGACLAGCSRDKVANPDDPANAPAAPVVKVTRQDIADRLVVASEFEPLQEINVYAKVSGYVQKLNIDWGTHVHQGDVMAVLEIPEMEQQLQLDAATLQRYEHDVTHAREDVNRAQSAYNVAHLSFTRLAEVQKARPELIAQQDVDAAQGKDEEAGANLSGARAAFSAAEQAVLAARAALEKDRAIFAYSRITAPFDGVVTEMDAFTGALLPAGTSSSKGDLALCKLSQNNILRLVIPVPERAVPEVKIGQAVELKVATLDRTLQGKIARVSGEIDPATRTMHTEIQVPNADYSLVPGMYASVDLPLNAVEGALTVPVQAVEPSGEGRGTALVISSSNRIERREVVLGIQTANYVQIVSGLREGEQVVFGGQGRYRSGQLVKPQPTTPGKME